MKRLVYSALCMALIFVLAACGGRAEVDEELLPTRIPTLSAADFAPDAPAVAEAPASPTATPEAPAPSEEITDTAESADTEEATASEEVTESAEITETEELTTSEEVTGTDESADTETGTEEVTDTSEVTATNELTSTDEVANGEESAVTESEAITETDSEQGATPLVPLPTVTVAAGDAVTETEEATDAAEVTTTETTTTTEEAGTEEADTEEAAAEDTETEAAAEEGAAEEEAATDGATGDEATGDEANVDPALVGLPEEILAAMATADPERGQQLTLSNACIGCHTPTPNTMTVGPTWYNVATTAEHRIEGMSSGLYLYNSIVHPNDYVVEGYIPGLMLQTYGTLPAQDLADLVSYLLTLKEGS